VRNTILSFGAAAILLFALAPCARSQPQQQDSNQTPAPPSGEARKGPDGSTRGQQGRGRGLFGKISALQSDSIEVTRPDGTKISVKLTASTEFRKEREPAKLSDFKVGDNVVVRTNQAEADAAGATAVMVASVPAGFAGRGGPGGPGGMPGTQGKDFVMGEVKSLDPPKITVLRVDNVTQILELNEDTSLRKGRESITMADIQPGDYVIARGALANDVFVAKTLNVVPPEMWKRMQEMMSGVERGEAGPPKSGQAPPAQQAPPEKPN
jgi:hypothetical protein